MKTFVVLGLVVILATLAGILGLSYKRDSDLERALGRLDGANELSLNEITSWPTVFDSFSAMTWIFSVDDRVSSNLYDKCRTNSLSNYNSNGDRNKECLVSLYYDCQNYAAYNLTVKGRVAKVSVIPAMERVVVADGAVCRRPK